MAATLSTVLLEKEKTKGKEASSGMSRERQLQGVIRILAAEKLKLEAPLKASKRLARYCQSLKIQNERLKERAQNFEMGMVRAERRSAQLQNDLHKARSNQPATAPETSRKPAQFFLPSSIQMLVDSLTTQNVILMKGLNKATEHPKGADLVEVGMGSEK